MNPKDFDPFRGQIRDCYCPLCNATATAGRGPDRRASDAANLLAALQAGTHTRVELAQMCADARREHDAKVAKACADGATDFEMFLLTAAHFNGREDERFYGLPFQDFHAGWGLTRLRDHEETMAWRGEFKAGRDRELAARVPALVAADPRNACVCFRQTRQLCTHHAALAVPEQEELTWDNLLS